MESIVCEKQKEGSSPYFVMELKTGYIVMEEQPSGRGDTLFLCKKQVRKMSQLENEFRLQFLDEMSIVGEAVDRAFQADVMHYELMETGQLCWKLFPRLNGDRLGTESVCFTPHKNRTESSKKQVNKELENMKEMLKEQLAVVLKEREDIMRVIKVVPRWMK